MESKEAGWWVAIGGADGETAHCTRCGCPDAKSVCRWIAAVNLAKVRQLARNVSTSPQLPLPERAA